MNLRLWSSIALIVVLFCLWRVMTKPTCPDGLAASLGTRSLWACVAAASIAITLIEMRRGLADGSRERADRRHACNEPANKVFGSIDRQRG